MGKQIQFELWRECNCKCTYCTLGNDNNYTSEELKLNSINTAINEIKKFKKDEYDVLGFIGGEFFQGQLNTDELRNKFFELIGISNDLLNNNIIRELWINASLLLGNQKDLYNLINLIDKKSNLWILTSYDTLGRFHTEKMLETWDYHMKNIHNLYPEVKLNTTIIITNNFITKYLNDEFNIKNFKSKYNTNIFLKTTVKPGHLMKLSKQEINQIIGDFFPTKKQFIKFLYKFKLKEGIDEYNNLFSNNLRAEEVRKNFNDEYRRNIKFIRDKHTLKETIYIEDEFIDSLPCGHSSIYQSYVDSDDCSICDKQKLLNI